MKAVFVELPAFSRYRADYLTDENFHALQIRALFFHTDLVHFHRAGAQAAARSEAARSWATALPRLVDAC